MPATPPARSPCHRPRSCLSRSPPIPSSLRFNVRLTALFAAAAAVAGLLAGPVGVSGWDFPANPLDPDRPKMATIFSVECTPYFDWQTVGLMHSYRKSKQPGPIVRLLSCTDDDLAQYRHMDLAPTLTVPSMTHHPRTGDWYAAINKPAGVVHWLQHHPLAQEVEWVVILDADMVIRSPVTPWGVGAQKGQPVAAYYGYLIGCDNILAQLHTRNPHLCPKVGGFIVMHIDDLRRMAPLWLSKTEEVRADKDHYATNITGDIYGQGWISEMYGYSFASADAELVHKTDYESMIYPGYVPAPTQQAKLLHYGLTFRVGSWHFGKSEHEHDTIVAMCNKLFDAPPFPFELLTDNEGQRRADLLSIECANTINEGLLIHHATHSCPTPHPSTYVKFLINNIKEALGPEGYPAEAGAAGGASSGASTDAVSSSSVVGSGSGDGSSTSAVAGENGRAVAEPGEQEQGQLEGQQEHQEQQQEQQEQQHQGQEQQQQQQQGQEQQQQQQQGQEEQQQTHLDQASEEGSQRRELEEEQMQGQSGGENGSSLGDSSSGQGQGTSDDVDDRQGDASTVEEQGSEGEKDGEEEEGSSGEGDGEGKGGLAQDGGGGGEGSSGGTSGAAQATMLQTSIDPSSSSSPAVVDDKEEIVRKWTEEWQENVNALLPASFVDVSKHPVRVLPSMPEDPLPPDWVDSWQPFHVAGMPRMITLFSGECTNYFDWQSLGLFYSFKRARQPGKLVRLLACSADMLKEYKGLDIAPTMVVPNWNHNPRTGDWYSAINKPVGVLHWLQHSSDANNVDWVLILDADQIIRAPILPWEMGAEIGHPASVPYGYLIGCDNILGELHMSDPSSCDKVGGVLAMHVSDLRRLAPFWVSKTEEVRADRDHYATNITGDVYSSGWISEMYGYSFGASEVKLKHTVVNTIMLYPGYTPVLGVDPRLLHYGLPMTAQGWTWGKSSWRSPNVALECGKHFPDPPDISVVPRTLSPQIRRRDYISIECVAVLNRALREHHRRMGCPPEGEQDVGVMDLNGASMVPGGGETELMLADLWATKTKPTPSTAVNSIEGGTEKVDAMLMRTNAGLEKGFLVATQAGEVSKTLGSGGGGSSSRSGGESSVEVGQEHLVMDGSALAGNDEHLDSDAAGAADGGAVEGGAEDQQGASVDSAGSSEDKQTEDGTRSDQSSEGSEDTEEQQQQQQAQVQGSLHQDTSSQEGDMNSGEQQHGDQQVQHLKQADSTPQAEVESKSEKQVKETGFRGRIRRSKLASFVLGKEDELDGPGEGGLFTKHQRWMALPWAMVALSLLVLVSSGMRWRWRKGKGKGSKRSNRKVGSTTDLRKVGAASKDATV